MDIPCDDYESKEFLAACFHSTPKFENKNLITLTGAPDWMLLFWDWEKEKITNKINIGLTGIPPSLNHKGPDMEPDYNFTISFNPFEMDH